MSKRVANSLNALADGLLASPGLKSAPVLEMMCSQFVLTLAAKQGSKFNVRRDLNSLLSLTGRHMFGRRM